MVPESPAISSYETPGIILGILVALAALGALINQAARGRKIQLKN